MAGLSEANKMFSTLLFLNGFKYFLTVCEHSF